MPLSRKEGIKWQRPRFTRQALMQCCLVKWILSSTAPQGSGPHRASSQNPDVLFPSQTQLLGLIPQAYSQGSLKEDSASVATQGSMHV
ncbi:Calsenilin [Fukomys damarensis]|uniref:Calsenilin n=1 Tax=Fukomys damarensis TaxID=885580 RepID=A0A091D8F4_FUKDA|nr:Calsenilin [Fukomys damarensis]